MYEGPVRRSGGIATPRAPVPPNPVAFDHGIYPLTLHGRALTSGPPHPVVLGQTIGTLWSNTRAKGTARTHPCRPDASVSPLQVPVAAPSVREGGTRRRRGPGTCNRHNTSRLVRGRLRKIWRHVLAPGGPGHSRRHAESNPGRGNCSDTSPSPKTMKNYHQYYSTCAHVV